MITEQDRENLKTLFKESFADYSVLWSDNFQAAYFAFGSCLSAQVIVSHDSEELRSIMDYLQSLRKDFSV